MPSEAPLTILAGTMCLMSHYAQTGCARAAARIAVNLETLAGHAALSVELRRVCANLMEVWGDLTPDQQSAGRVAVTKSH